MTRLVSGIYHSIFTPPEAARPKRRRRKLAPGERRARKVAREIATSVRHAEPGFTVRERDLHRRQQARWAKANPEAISDAQKKWREKQDPALFREYDAKRYALNAEKIRARKRAYYAKNRARVRAQQQAKRAAERELRRPKKKRGPAILREV